MDKQQEATLLGVDSVLSKEELQEQLHLKLTQCDEQERESLIRAGEELLRSPLYETDSHPCTNEDTGFSIPPKDTQSLLTGKVLLNRYNVGELIGMGGMGQVYVCFDRVREDRIAIKRLHPNLASSKVACERFRLEARISCNLSHPGIARVYDVHDDQGVVFLTMELLKGINLRNEMIRRNTLGQLFSVDEICSWVKLLCEALEHAHGQMIHRDIKPENIWLCENGKVKLMDFGIATLLDNDQLTSTGMALGTLHYMSPEQLQGTAADASADQYALAATVYELLIGRPPQGAFKAPKNCRRDIPSVVSNAVMRGLNPEKSDRFKSIQDFSLALNQQSVRTPSVLMVVGVTIFLFLSLLSLTAIWFRYVSPQNRGASYEPALTAQDDEKLKENRATETSSPSVASGHDSIAKTTTNLALSDAPYHKNANTPEPTFKNSLGMSFVLIPNGSFVMGSPDEEESRDYDETQHEVHISRSFYLGTYEVSVAQFRRYIYESHGEHSLNWESPGFAQGEEYPAVNVSWFEANGFCEWLSDKEGLKYRLPTEAEWEYACRAGTSTMFWNGNLDFPQKQSLGFNSYELADGHQHTARLGSYRPNPWGLFDMHGNVWEWCSDWYNDYPLETSIDPHGTDLGKYRVIRGGSWCNTIASCRSAKREKHLPDSMDNSIGFRVVLIPFGL